LFEEQDFEGEADEQERVRRLAQRNPKIAKAIVDDFAETMGDDADEYAKLKQERPRQAQTAAFLFDRAAQLGVDIEQNKDALARAAQRDGARGVHKLIGRADPAATVDAYEDGSLDKDELNELMQVDRDEEQADQRGDYSRLPDDALEEAIEETEPIQ
jgi:hypothetical protein